MGLDGRDLQNIHALTKRRCMFIDEDNPSIAVVFAMLNEAVHLNVTRIILRRGESQFTVTYVSEEALKERDTIPNRHWHSWVAALHTLIAETVWHAIESGTTANHIANRVEISPEFPNLDNRSLRDLQKRLEKPLLVDLGFSDQEVQLALFVSAAV